MAVTLPGHWWTNKVEMYQRKNASIAQQMARRRYAAKKRRERKQPLKKNQAMESALEHAEHYAIDVYDRLASMHEGVGYEGIYSVKDTLKTLTESIRRLEEVWSMTKTTPSNS